MKLTIGSASIPHQTFAGNGGSDLFLTVRGFPASITFDSAEEAYEIAGAILAGLHKEIEAARKQADLDI